MKKGRTEAGREPASIRPILGLNNSQNRPLLFPPDYGIIVSACRSCPLGRTKKGNTTMNEINKLREEARGVIAAYKKGDDFDVFVNRLAAIGYALEDALARA